jgi:hypothetical protein
MRVMTVDAAYSHSGVAVTAYPVDASKGGKRATENYVAERN